jgi:hypothetical protein
MAIIPKLLQNYFSNFRLKPCWESILIVQDVLVDLNKIQRLFIFSVAFNGFNDFLLSPTIYGLLSVWLLVVTQETHPDLFEILLMLFFAYFSNDFLLFDVHAHSL